MVSYDCRGRTSESMEEKGVAVASLTTKSMEQR